MCCRALSSWLIAIICLQGVVVGEPVVVTLLDKQELSKPIVSIGDIAQVKGGDFFQRNKISGLDIAQMDKTSERVDVEKRHVHLRILLAGIPVEDFNVVGPNTTSHVKANEQSPDERVLRLLRPEVAKRLGVDESDIELRLLRPIPATLQLRQMITQPFTTCTQLPSHHENDEYEASNISIDNF